MYLLCEKYNPDLVTTCEIWLKAEHENSLFHINGYNPRICYDRVENKVGGGVMVWVTPRLKYLIDKYWDAFRTKNWPLFEHCKLKVKLEIAEAKKKWANKAFVNPRNM